jgi:signal transduction histidine kinase/CheY-like chemotaxis protein
MVRNMRLSTFNLLILLIISTVVLLIWTLNILEERDHYHRQTEVFSREYESSQKQLLSFVVGNAIDFINFKQSQIEMRIHRELQARVDEAYGIAEKLRVTNRGRLSEAEIQREILLALDSLRFNGDRGYYFVYTLGEQELLSSDRLGAKTGSEAQKREVVSNLVRIAREEGQGFYTYDWPKPGAPPGSYPKISFVRVFQPYNWIIGTGEYVDDMKAEIQKEVIQWINHLRFSEVGYLWIHSTELTMVVHPFYSREERSQWYVAGGLCDFADPEGKRLFAEMTDRCMESGSAYVDYLWSKPYHSGYFRKMSYVELIREWGWIVGAGVYVDDMERAIRQNELAIDKQVRSELIQLAVLAAGLVVILVGLTRFFHTRVQTAFATFGAHFQQAAHEGKQVDPGKLSFQEFKKLALYVNKMVGDQRAALNKLKKSEERLMQGQKMEAIGRLAGGIAHDFGNLMMTVHGYTEMLLWDSNIQDNVRTSLQEIQYASERASSLTHKLLAFSRRQILQPEIISVNRLVVDLEGILRRIIGEDVRLITDLGEHTGFIESDPVQIEQIVINLAVNARDAMPKGGTLRISTRDVELGKGGEGGKEGSSDRASHVLLQISDTGIGMDTDTQQHVFEPFFTTKAMGKGTGLGLSTVYGIVKQSGGNILVSSEPGKGTNFSIYFPRVEKQLVEDEEPDKPSVDCGDGETILLVEDEAKVREMIAQSLRRVGFQVLEASDGGEALNLLRRVFPRKIDLILTDVVMPIMGGDELMERLPAPYKDTPILFMSGYPGRRNVRNKPYIQKPFSHQSLCTKIRELLSSGTSKRIACGES